ncbi:MAG TPA: S-layer homology domain-containing protein, partial [Gelria sp.]|nr:S-layer homology domain-containing protein [Gelria sp.]
TFGPDDLITREQAAVIVSLATKLEAATGELSFTDSKAISPWAKPGVAAAFKGGFISGYPDGTFKPQGNTTRAEAAIIIGKLI